MINLLKDGLSLRLLILLKPHEYEVINNALNRLRCKYRKNMVKVLEFVYVSMCLSFVHTVAV